MEIKELLNASFIGIALLVVGCAKNEGNIIDLSNLSEISLCTDATCPQNIEYIELQSNDSVSLSSPSVFYCDSTLIMVEDRRLVHLFDRNGKHIRQIGNYGKGYGEYGRLASSDFNDNTQTIYLTTYGNRTLKYGIDGKYLGDLKINGLDNNIISLTWSNPLQKFVAETRDYRPDGLDIYISLVDTIGMVTKTSKVYSDKLAFDKNLTCAGMVRHSQSGSFFFAKFDDVIYELHNDTIIPVYHMNLGGRKANRQMIEDCGNSDKRLRECLDIENILITDNNIYISISDLSGSHKIVYDRIKEEIIYDELGQPYKYSSLKPYADGTTVMWPFGLSGDNLYTTIFSSEIDDKTANEIIDSNFQRIIKSSDDAPLLLLAKNKP